MTKSLLSSRLRSHVRKRDIGVREKITDSYAQEKILAICAWIYLYIITFTVYTRAFIFFAYLFVNVHTKRENVHKVCFSVLLTVLCKVMVLLNCFSCFQPNHDRFRGTPSPSPSPFSAPHLYSTSLFSSTRRIPPRDTVALRVANLVSCTSFFLSCSFLPY